MARDVYAMEPDVWLTLAHCMTKRLDLWVFGQVTILTIYDRLLRLFGVLVLTMGALMPGHHDRAWHSGSS